MGSRRFAQSLIDSPDSPLHEGRWLLSCESPLRRWRHPSTSHAEYWSSMLVDGHPDGYIDWFLHAGAWEVLPLRPMPDADDSRVKAYRKQAREGTLPPVLLWWVSGLDCHLILDGHARLAAAIAESVEPPLLQLHRTVSRDDLAARVDEAVGSYEDELARFTELRAVHGPTVPGRRRHRRPPARPPPARPEHRGTADLVLAPARRGGAVASHRTRSDRRPGLSHHLNPAESLPHVRGQHPPQAGHTELRKRPGCLKAPTGSAETSAAPSPVGPARRCLRRTPHRATGRGAPLWVPESAVLGAGLPGVEGSEPVERR
ncbi:hypothetical protein ACRJ4W_09550 [Streptomyces sp. GLT-R25]